MKAAVLDDWDDAWAADAVAAIVTLADKYQTVTADDLRKHMRPPNRPSQYGAAFRSAQAQGLIEVIDSQKSSSKSRNHGRNLRWRRKQEGITQ